VANPIALSATPVAYRRVPPPLAGDDAAIRAWLGGDAGEALAS
jgi:hypothetical protein